MSRVRSLGSLAAIAVAVFVVPWSVGALFETATRSTPRPPPRGQIIEAAAGSLDEIAIQFHLGTGGETFLPVYAQVFEALTEQTTVFVVVGDDDDRRAFEVARRGWPSPGPAVRYVNAGRRITNWARDRMAVMRDGEGDPIVVAPPRAHAGALARASDWHVPWILRGALGAGGRVVVAPFVFEGGDLIADEAHVYAATPLLGRNASRSAADLEAQLSALVGRDALMLGEAGDPAPDHHVGMFTTPLGDGVVAYADPRLGSSILFGAAEGEEPAVRTVEAGGRTYTVDERSDTRRRFERVAEDLRGAGLETVALPAVPTTSPFVWLAYDNVLIDVREDGRHVLMPVYGVPALDEAAADVYRAIGYVVHPIDVRTIFHLGGTVRCLGAVLRRGGR